jgi:hypothetical protein
MLVAGLSRQQVLCFSDKGVLLMPIDNVEMILRILESENRLIERADQKSISLLSILGVFMVFFIVYYRVIPVNPLTLVMVMLYFVFAILSIYNLIMAIKPRIRTEQADTKAPPVCDPTFFGGICRFADHSSYKEALQEMIKDESSVIETYSREIYNIARINSEKYRHVQRGVFLVISTLAIELAIIVYLFIFYMGEGVVPPILK